MITAGLAAWRSTGAKDWVPLWLPYSARAYTELDQLGQAWNCISDATAAVLATQEKWCEAEVHRTAGQIALMSPERDLDKAEAYLERALAIAREQQAKSWNSVPR